MVEVPMWLYESTLYGVSAFIFCSIVGPLCWYIGRRDCDRAAYRRGFERGLKHKRVSPFDGELS
jgi:hypothetical protein